MKSSITKIEVDKAQVCWVATLWYSVHTHVQFTAESHYVTRGGRHGWRGLLGIASALINALKAKRKAIAFFESEQGPFNN